jgi:hypothetical protein
LVDADANAALNQTQAVETLLPPVVSEYVNVNVCEAPNPVSGDAPSAVTAVALPGTVHEPRVCHPLFTLEPLAAYM